MKNNEEKSFEWEEISEPIAWLACDHVTVISSGHFSVSFRVTLPLCGTLNK